MDFLFIYVPIHSWPSKKGYVDGHGMVWSSCDECLMDLLNAPERGKEQIHTHRVGRLKKL